MAGEDNELDKPVTQKQFLEVITNYATKKDLEQFATKKDLEVLKTELKKEMDAKFEELKLMIMSQRAGIELAGEIVPTPAEGVVDSDGDLGAYHRITMALRRDKGGVLVVCMVPFSSKKRKVKRWKYE
jgi:predicted XRE-type DNA-binding protein